MFVCLFFLSHSISAALFVCIYLTVDGWPLCVSSVLYFMEPLLADTEREVKRRKSRRPVESNKKHRRRQQVLRWLAGQGRRRRRNKRQRDGMEANRSSTITWSGDGDLPGKGRLGVSLEMDGWMNARNAMKGEVT